MREVFLALALCLMFEGLLFALSPTRLREALTLLNRLPDKTLRLIGGFAVSLGLLFFILISKF
jgi:uncharacterized protein